MKKIAVVAVLSGLWLLTAMGSLLVLSEEPVLAQACQEFTQAEASFQRLVQLRAENPGTVNAETYKTAALATIKSADDCYQASVPAHLQGTSGPIQIDDGGVWAPGSLGEVLQTQYVTAGTKWPGAVFSGVASSGGIVTYSYIISGVTYPLQTLLQNKPVTNTDVRTGLDVSCNVTTEIQTAFAAWAAVADIEFEPIEEVGITPPNENPAPGNVIGDIRIGAYDFGPPVPLGIGYFPPETEDFPSTLIGDIYFNIDDTISWACEPGSGEVDIGLVALHEVGHAIGLDHELSDKEVAVMNPGYNQNLPWLQPDDIRGAIAIYGKKPILDLSCVSPALTMDQWMTDSTTLITNYWKRTSEGWWFVANIGQPSLATLESPLLNNTTGLLSFRHKFNTEHDPSFFYDGGLVEIYLGSGWKPITRGTFIQYPYNGKIAEDLLENPLLVGPPSKPSVEVFSGDTEGEIVTSMINLDDLVPDDNTSFKIRFSFGTDVIDLGGAVDGWTITDITLCSIPDHTYFLPVFFKSG